MTTPISDMVPTQPSGRTDSGTKQPPGCGDQMDVEGTVSRPVRPHSISAQASHSAPSTGRSDGWLPSLEGLRALAVLGVVVHHVSFLSGLTNSFEPLAGPLARLDVGIAIFFALSGFLLYRPFALATIQGQAQPPIRRYLWHRALRIMPGYWAMAAVALVWLNIDYMKSVWDWAIPLLLAQIYQPLRLPVGMEQTWSLATEATFYLALPAIAVLGHRIGGRTPLVRARRQLAIGALLVLAGLTWNAYAHGPDSPLPGLAVLWLPAFLDWFGLGIMLAVLASWPSRTTSPPFLTDLAGGEPGRGNEDLWSATPRGLRVVTFAPGTSWLIAGALLWIASTPIAGPRGVEGATPVESVTEHLLFLAITWCVIAPLVGPGSGGVPRALLGHRAVLFLGRISYGIFLWHLLALEACFRLLGFTRMSSSFWVLLVLTMALTIPVATASYYLIERPARRLRRIWQRRADRPGLDVGADSLVQTPAPGPRAPSPVPAGPPTLAALLVPSTDTPEPQYQGGDRNEEQPRREHDQ
ncbi:acyltransferase family protein [Micromonospora profundi]|uniref:acyltransferase family protein n=1 Tax=Micromonospora profundi TaxID=1420889 RepID=UPI0037FC424E